MEARRAKGIAMAVDTLEALLEDRADDERVWASVLKEALKRRHPGFNENYHGFKTFGGLLEEAQKRELLEFGRDEKSGAYVKRRIGAAAAAPVEELRPAAVEAPVTAEAIVAPAPAEPAEPPAARRRSRGRKATGEAAPAPAAEVAATAPVEPETAAQPAGKAKAKPKAKKPAAPRKPRAAAKKKTASE
jgi:hypothetical protein